MKGILDEEVDQCPKTTKLSLIILIISLNITALSKNS